MRCCRLLNRFVSAELRRRRSTLFAAHFPASSQQQPRRRLDSTPHRRAMSLLMIPGPVEVSLKRRAFQSETQHCSADPKTSQRQCSKLTMLRVAARSFDDQSFKQYDAKVLTKLGEQTLSHTSPVFIEEFGQTLEQLHSVLQSDATRDQTLVLSGSGTLGWDVCLANLAQRGDKVLVVNSGYFSDSFASCAQSYELRVEQVKAQHIGDTVTDSELRHALQQHSDAKLILLTHVDTSTAVKNDIESMSRAARELAPHALIVVDGVCSMGGEEFRMSKWHVDVALTCSQKALGVPPGLCVVCLSARALAVFAARTQPVPAYYCSLANWLPIMQAYQKRQPSYFATPNVNLIRALHSSLTLILASSPTAANGDEAMTRRWSHHALQSRAFKAAAEALHLRQVPTASAHSANTLSALYLPQGVTGPQLLGALSKEHVICAGGLHKEIKATYFRVGHMGVSVERKDVRKVVIALEAALAQCGVKLEKPNQGLAAFDAVIAAASAQSN